MLRSFLAETNDALVNVWNQEDGITPAITEATNIAAGKIKPLVLKMRKAIDSGDSKTEKQMGDAIKKEMSALAKPIMSDFAKAFVAFVKEQKKTLSNKYGVDLEVYNDGKPVLQFGTQNSYYDAKSSFGVVLVVETPDVDGGSKDAAADENVEVEHGFDLTHFDKPENFLKFLKMVGASDKAKLQDGIFYWTGPGIEIRTGNNPITGEYRNSNRENDPGYASYIGLKGDSKKVEKAAAYIRKFDPKEETPGEARFI